MNVNGGSNNSRIPPKAQNNTGVKNKNSPNIILKDKVKFLERTSPDPVPPKKIPPEKISQGGHVKDLAKTIGELPPQALMQRTGPIPFKREPNPAPPIVQSDRSNPSKPPQPPQPMKPLPKQPVKIPSAKIIGIPQARQVLVKPNDSQNSQKPLSAIFPTSELLRRRLQDHTIRFTSEESLMILSECLALGKRESLKASQQELIVIMGNTGAGKSTFANYLHGCEMKLVDPKSLKVESIVSKVVVVKGTREGGPSDELMQIGHTKVSTTFIPHIEKGILGMSYCDCPGFLDNRGVEISIANAVNIKNALLQAKGIKIVLLLNYHSLKGDRGNGLKKMIDVTCHLFGSKERLIQHSSSIIFGVTQIPRLKHSGEDDERESIENLREFLVNPPLEDPIDQEVIFSLSQRLFTYDPLDQDNLEFEGAWNRDQIIAKIAEMDSIGDPSTTFQPSLTPADEQGLKHLFEDFIGKIENAISLQDYQNAAYYLNQLKSLEVLEHSYVIKLIVEANRRLINHFNSRIQQLDEVCSNVLQDNSQYIKSIFIQIQDNLKLFDEEIKGSIDLAGAQQRIVFYELKLQALRKSKDLLLLIDPFYRCCQEQKFNVAEGIINRLNSELSAFETAYAGTGIWHGIDLNSLKNHYSNSVKQYQMKLKQIEDEKRKQEKLERRRQEEIKEQKRREKQRQAELEEERAEQERIRHDAEIARYEYLEAQRLRNEEQRLERQWQQEREEREEKRRQRQEEREERAREREEERERNRRGTFPPVFVQPVFYNPYQFNPYLGYFPPGGY